MSIDPNDIQLTPDQRKKLASLADLAGLPWQNVVDELLLSGSPMSVPFRVAKAGSGESGKSNGGGSGKALEALEEAGVVEAVGPSEYDATAQLLPPDEWVKQFTAWAEGHTPRNPHLDDSRDAIYEDQG